MLHHKKRGNVSCRADSSGRYGEHGGITTWKEELEEVGEVGSLGQGVFLASFLRTELQYGKCNTFAHEFEGALLSVTIKRKSLLLAPSAGSAHLV